MGMSGPPHGNYDEANDRVIGTLCALCGQTIYDRDDEHAWDCPTQIPEDTKAPTHALVGIDEHKPRKWESGPTYVAVCMCGYASLRLSTKEAAARIIYRHVEVRDA